MTLGGFFVETVSPIIRSALSDAPGLEEALYLLLRAGQEKFPDIRLPASDFVRFLSRHLPETTRTVSDVAALHGAEIYLVCAYGQRDAVAQRELEDVYMRKVRRALLGLGLPEAVCSDIEQDLRKRLIEMQDASIHRKGYSGRSELAGWLCLSGVRAARMLHRRHFREQSLEQASAQLLPAPDFDPALALMIKTYKSELQSAFASAVASLSVRERNLLRYHFLDKLSIDQIGKLYRIHRATAARWIHQAQDTLCNRTREHFHMLVPASPASFADLMALLRSQVSLSLVQVLHRSPEPERSPQH